MAILSLNNISLTFSGTPLLDGVNLQIEEGEKVCLIGRNGAGKSTLMKVINGDIVPDGGDISYQQGITSARLTQEIPADEYGTIYDVVARGLGEDGALVSDYHRALSRMEEEPGNQAYLDEYHRLQHLFDERGAADLPIRIDRVISQMELNPEAEFNSLSVGVKRRTLLARALLSDPEILILDEPTNHLDVEAIQWLEKFLKGYKKTLFFVTHDRAFVRNIASRIVYLDRGMLKSYSCSYDKFLERLEEDLQAEERENALFDKKLAEEEAWIRRGVKARTRRNEGRVKALKKMRDERANRRELAGSARLAVQDAERSGKLVIEAKGLSFGYDGASPVVNDFSTTIKRGDKIGILGPNGCGKSTLLNLLLGNLKPQVGSVREGTRLEPAYFDQSRNQLDESKSLQENVAADNDTIFFNGRPRHIMGYLQDFLFTPFQIKSFVSTLSGGERNRLLLAKLFTQPANLLILDEPTNDLDLETLELLEEMLINYEGTVLLVSHDREFLNNVVTDTIVFEGEGMLVRYTGGYDEQEAARGSRAKEKEEVKKEKAVKVKTDKGKKLSYKEKRELEELPLKIEQLEEEQTALYKKVEDPEFYKGDPAEIKKVQERMEELEAELPPLYERWEELEAIEG